MKQTIAEITNLLKEEKTIDSIKEQDYYDDERKGVQTAIQRRIKQLEKEQALLKKYEVMSQFENDILKDNPESLICGIDEVGRGPLAGPVVACAVILNKGHQYTGLNDSKQLSANKRKDLENDLSTNVYDYAYGSASVDEIDRINIYEATKIAMKRAIAGLSVQPDHLLIDAMTLDTDIPQTSIIKGDAKSISIAAASVLAKEHRDHYMKELSKKHNVYGFEKNVGYGTQQHLDGIKKHGIISEHRKSFEPIKSHFI